MKDITIRLYDEERPVICIYGWEEFTKEDEELLEEITKLTYEKEPTSN